MGEDIRESSVPFDLNRYPLEEEIKELTTYCLHDVRTVSYTHLTFFCKTL